jgi:SAM-dependent methyltransferase
VTEADAVPTVPRRLRWAVELLALRPTDRVLEIGCGRGVAAALVCDALTDGRYVGLDRSATAIAAARARIPGHVADGRAVFVHAPLTEDALDAAWRFDTVFAVNVNLFWTGDSASELALIARTLAPEGTLHLCYEPPSPGQLRDLKGRLTRALTAHGFTAESTVDSASGLLAVSGRPVHLGDG